MGLELSDIPGANFALLLQFCAKEDKICPSYWISGLSVIFLV